MAPGSETDTDSNPASESFSRLHLFLWTGLILVISIAVTGFVVWNSQVRADLELHAGFQRRFVDVVARHIASVGNQGFSIYRVPPAGAGMTNFELIVISLARFQTYNF